MAEKSNRFSRFWQELKRRKTERVLIVYAATAFVILQLADILTPALLPEWSKMFIIIILVIGFPITAIFSWFFDITPGGIEKTKPLSGKKRSTTQKELKTWKSTTLISFIVIIALLLFNVIKSSIGSYEIKRIEKSLAVIPFDEMICDSKEYSHLGDAIANVISTTLTGIEGFKVVSYTSSSHYKGPNRPDIKQIGRELGANFIVEGSFELLKGIISFNVQVINAKSGYHIWAEEFSGRVEELQTIRTNINIKIADALKIALSPEEIKQIKKDPTTSFSAYSHFLRGDRISEDPIYYTIIGNKYIDSLRFARAIENYDKAIKDDSTFALAYAKRAITRSWIYYTSGSNEPDKILKCKADIDKALEIDPELTEAQIALGFYYYYCKREYPEALKHFKDASDKNPENWQPKFYIALVHRRNGDWAMSQSLMAKVLKCNPQDALVLTNIGLSYDYLKNYDTALIYHDKAIKVMPNWESPYINKIETLIRKNGSTGEAKNLMDTAIQKTGKSFISLKVLMDLYDGKFEEALIQTKNILNKTDLSDNSFLNSHSEKLLLCAMIHSYLNNPEIARTYFDSALIVLKKELIDNPESAKSYSNTGIAYAGLKNRLKAIESGEKAIKLTADNALDASDRIRDLAQIYVMLGDYDKCLKLIEELLKNPSCFSLGLMKLDPVWKPLIFLPEFQDLLIKYSKI